MIPFRIIVLNNHYGNTNLCGCRFDFLLNNSLNTRPHGRFHLWIVVIPFKKMVLKRH